MGVFYFIIILFTAYLVVYLNIGFLFYTIHLYNIFFMNTIMKETKTKTQISEKIAVMVVMISSLALAAGLILGAIQTTKKDTRSVAEEPDTEVIEEDSESIETELMVIDNRDLTAIIMDTANREDYLEIKQAIKSQGGRALLKISNIVLSDIENDKIESIKNNKLVDNVISGTDIDSLATFTNYDKSTQDSLTTIKNLIYQQEEIQMEGLLDLGNDSVDPNVNEIITAGNDRDDPIYNSAPSIPPELGMIGDIYIEYIYVESNEESTNTTDWSQSEWQETYANFVNGLLMLARQAPPETELSFIVDVSPPTEAINQTIYDPNTTDYRDDYQSDLMLKRGICTNINEETGECQNTSGDSYELVDEYTYQLTIEKGYPQALVAFVVRDINSIPTDHTYPFGARRGSFVILNYSRGCCNEDGSRITLEDIFVSAHEVTHVFYSWDQYQVDASCQVSNGSPESLRVIAAGGTDNYENANTVSCFDYMPSIMKGSTLNAWMWRDYTIPGGYPHINMDWHFMAQIGWGDQPDQLMLKVDNPNLSAPINIYIDGERVGSKNIKSSDRYYYLYFPVEEGQHSIEINGPTGISTIGGSVSVTTTNDPGPINGTGVVDVNVKLECTTSDCSVCSDGTYPGQCNSDFQLCKNKRLTQKDCRECGCPATGSFCEEQQDATWECVWPDPCEANPDAPGCTPDFD